MKRKTYRQLELEIKSLKASLPISHTFAFNDLKNALREKMTGSGVLLELKYIDGEDIINPVMISQGLSKETIDDLKKDILQSFEYNSKIKPAEVVS